MSSPFGGEGAAWGGRPRARAQSLLARWRKTFCAKRLSALARRPGFFLALHPHRSRTASPILATGASLMNGSTHSLIAAPSFQTPGAAGGPAHQLVCVCVCARMCVCVHVCV